MHLSRQTLLERGRDEWHSDIWGKVMEYVFSGQRPSTGTGKVIQRLRREKKNKIEREKASNKIS